MKIQKKILTILLVLLPLPVYSGDLDDGISIGSPINDDLKLDTNTLFLIQRAKAKVKEKKNNPKNKRIIISEKCGGSGNINLIGTKLKSNTSIINLSDNRKSSNVCKK